MSFWNITRDKYMYATTSEEAETMRDSHGLLPFLLDTEGRSRKKAERETRRLTQAIYFTTVRPESVERRGFLPWSGGS
jgi:hypothetical protein